MQIEIIQANYVCMPCVNMGMPIKDTYFPLQTEGIFHGITLNKGLVISLENKRNSSHFKVNT